MLFYHAVLVPMYRSKPKEIKKNGTGSPQPWLKRDKI